MLVAVLAATLTVCRGLGSQDNVLAAASVAQRPPQFHSTDEAAVGAWCERESGRAMPVAALFSLTPQCACADRVASVRVVTVQYKTGVGSRVTVCWLDDTPGPPSINDRSARGQTVLLVRSTSGTAVVAGDAPEQILRSTAARLQAACGAAMPAAVS